MEAASTKTTVRPMIEPANDVLPAMSRATLMTLDRLQLSGFDTAIGV